MKLPLERRATAAQSDAIEPGALTIETVGGQAEGAVRVAGRLVIDSSPRLRATLSQLLNEQVGRVIVVDLYGDGAYVLNGAIERLEEVDRGRDVVAVCDVAARLVDAHTRAIAWSRAESATVAVTQRDVPGVVGSLTAATRAAIDRLVASLEKQVAPGEPRP